MKTLCHVMFTVCLNWAAVETAWTQSEICGDVDGDGDLEVVVVRSPEKRRAGLMYRRSLPPDEGMLFVFPSPHRISLWMKNTYIPLSAAFIDQEGRIVNIAERMEPLDEERRYQSVAPAKYVLEVNAGWFRNHGVSSGDWVNLEPALSPGE